MSTFKIELNIALIPEPDLAQKLTRLSQEIAHRHPETIVQLGRSDVRLSLAPHLTLYQVSIPASNLEKVSGALRGIATKLAVISTEATQYAYNQTEGSLEIQRKKSPELIAAQEKVIALVSPLREGLLLEHDPGGNDPSQLLGDSNELGNNIRMVGYGEVGGLYRPHDTLNWFTPNTPFNIEEESLPSPDTLHGKYGAIGLFVLGPQGTCPQLLESLTLG